VLHGLHRYLERTGLRLEDLFAAGTTAAGATTGAPATTSSTVTTAASPPATPPGEHTTDVEQRLRLAYCKLAARPGDRVSLTDLRPLLGTVPRDEVDAVLRSMSRARRAHLVPLANQKVLTQADREAAVRI